MLLEKKREELAEGKAGDQKDILSLLVRDNLGSEDPLTDKEITDQVAIVPLALSTLTHFSSA